MPRVNPLEKYAYLVGTKINKWTVLSLKNDRRHADAVCRCDCGTIKPVNIRNLINNCTLELLPNSNKFNRRVYRCKCDCGNEIILPSSSLTTGHTSSCGCLLSYYNMYISKLLTEKEIEYIAEYPICIDERRYRFDFYLPNYNLFIEYDVEQHYHTARYFGADKEKNELEFVKIQTYDKIKDKYCKDNNINLLRIPYWEKKNIETIISDCLQRLNDKGFVKTA